MRLPAGQCLSTRQSRRIKGTSLLVASAISLNRSVAGTSFRAGNEYQHGRVPTIQITALHERNKRIVLVTSGAVGAGRRKLNKQAIMMSSLRSQMGDLNNPTPHDWDPKVGYRPAGKPIPPSGNR